MSVKRNTEGLRQSAQRKRQAALDKVEQGIRQLIKDGKTINFNTVAEAAGVSKAFLYKESAIKERIEQLRHQGAKSQQPPKQRASDASKDNLITMLRGRIKALEAENQALRRQNEVAYSYVLKVRDLEQEVKRLQSANKKTDQKEENRGERPKALNSLIDELGELGVTWNSTLARLINETPKGIVEVALEALREAIMTGHVQSRGGFLNKAITDAWQPNETYQEKADIEQFNAWWKWAHGQGLVKAATQIDGVQQVLTADEKWMPFEEAVALYGHS